MAMREIEAGAADMLSTRRGGGHAHACTFAFRVLLDDDGVGAGRYDATGEDARGLTLVHAAREWMSGCDLADDFERHRNTRHVGRADRVAVHGGEIGRRLGAQRYHVGGEHAAVRIIELGGFRRQRSRTFKHAHKRIGDRHQ